MLQKRTILNRSQSIAVLHGGKRRATATVELAVLLPVILIIVLGSIESASMIFLRQALVQSAYEAAKVAVKTGDSTQSRNTALAVTKGRRINRVSINFEPTDVKNAKRGSLIRVNITAPGDTNSVIPFGVFRGRTISATAVMARE